MAKIRVGVLGYGNLGRGVELALRQSEDMELVAVFTRRDPATLKLASDAPVRPASDLDEAARNDIDVLVICGGSATDLPVQTPYYASRYVCVDSFDTHAKIPDHFAAVDAAAIEGEKLAIISTGWDPGLFSLNRFLGGCFIPQGNDYTFWGTGVSQGHSDAIRRIEGVADARQYTIPCDDALDAVRRGENPQLTTRQKHTRECFVVLEEGADAQAIEQQIVSMPNYFSDYDTTVHFVSKEELARDHAGMPHGGFVLRSGQNANGNSFLIEYSLKLDSNPEFTSSVLVAFARAAYRMHAQGQVGCRTVFDVPPALLSPYDGEYLRSHLL